MYVLRCADGTLYAGYAVDVEARIAAHNAGKGAKYTKARRPVMLEACAAFPTKHEAMSAESRFKRLSRAQKLAVLASAQDEDGFLAALRETFPDLCPCDAVDEEYTDAITIP